MMERVGAFLAAILDGPAPGIAALAKALDLLAGVYHDTQTQPFSRVHLRRRHATTGA